MPDGKSSFAIYARIRICRSLSGHCVCTRTALKMSKSSEMEFRDQVVLAMESDWSALKIIECHPQWFTSGMNNRSVTQRRSRNLIICTGARAHHRTWIPNNTPRAIKWLILTTHNTEACACLGQNGYCSLLQWTMGERGVGSMGTGSWEQRSRPRSH